jgi:hypothetical protein
VEQDKLIAEGWQFGPLHVAVVRFLALAADDVWVRQSVVFRSVLEVVGHGLAANLYSAIHYLRKAGVIEMRGRGVRGDPTELRLVRRQSRQEGIE